jgi:FkbM family methyltransferase
MTNRRPVQTVIEQLKRARHRWLLRRWLRNGEEVWRAYRGGLQVPVLQFRNGLSLSHGPDDAAVFLFLEIFANGCYRDALKNAGGGTIVDIGANIGAFTLQALDRADVQVHAYEPNPRTLSVLRRNLAANALTGRVALHEEAVGRGGQPLSLNTSGPSLTSSCYTQAPHSAITVPSVGFDTVVARANGAISLVKIDAEGAEVDILAGASREALRAVPRMVLECHDWLVADATSRVGDLLGEAGFRVAVRRHGRATLVSADRRTTEMIPQ